MISTRAWIAILVALAALFGIERASSSRSASDSDARIELFAARERRGTAAIAAIAAITIERPLHDAERGAVRGERRDESFFYARSKGVWRCREAFGAIADAGRVEDFVKQISEARGVEMSSDAKRATSYGLDDAQRVRFTFHGTKALEDKADADRILAFDVGDVGDVGAVARADPRGGARSRAFVRAVGSTRILEIDRDPLALMDAPPGAELQSMGAVPLFAPVPVPPPRAGLPALPPWTDTRLLAGSTSSGFATFQRIVIEPVAGRHFELVCEPPAKKGDPPSWFVVIDGTRKPAIDERIVGFESFWFRGRYDGVESPLRAKSLGLDASRSKVTLVPNEGDPIALEIGATTATNDLPVWNRKTNVVYLMRPEFALLLAPDSAQFLDAAIKNPWDAWMRK